MPAARGVSMSEAQSVRSVHTAVLTVGASVAETMRRAGAREDRFRAERVVGTARQAVAAWAMAVDGDAAMLAAHASPDAVHWLLHPVRKPWQVAPGPVVTQIEIWDLEDSADPPRLRVKFQFTGWRLLDDPDQAEESGAETLFVGMLDLTLDDAGQRTWRLASGHVQTLDEFLGYVFTSRQETAEEHRQRTGSSPVPPSGGTRLRTFLIRAGFADHDVRFGSSATVEVRQDSEPSREDAVRLVWPAIEREVSQALGEGDWRPSLNWLDVIELQSSRDDA
jgi:hypothetical protein